MQTTATHHVPTRDRLVDVALELFRLQGYHATSIAQILEKAGANSGSLYHFFKGKEELLLAVLDRYVELLWPAVMEPVFAQVKDPIERIFGILDGYRQALIGTKLTYGCPIGKLALEVTDTQESAREKIALNFANWRDWVRKCLDDAGDRLPADLDRDKLAAFVLTVMEGGVMQARTHRSLEPFDACVEQLRDYFGRLMEDSSNQRSEYSHQSLDRR